MFYYRYKCWLSTKLKINSYMKNIGRETESDSRDTNTFYTRFLAQNNEEEVELVNLLILANKSLLTLCCIACTILYVCMTKISILK